MREREEGFVLMGAYLTSTLDVYHGLNAHALDIIAHGYG